MPSSLLIFYITGPVAVWLLMYAVTKIMQNSYSVKLNIAIICTFLFWGITFWDIAVLNKNAVELHIAAQTTTFLKDNNHNGKPTETQLHNFKIYTNSLDDNFTSFTKAVVGGGVGIAVILSGIMLVLAIKQKNRVFSLFSLIILLVCSSAFSWFAGRVILNNYQKNLKTKAEYNLVKLPL